MAILLVTGLRGSKEYNAIVFEEFREHDVDVVTMGYPKYIWRKILNILKLKKFNTGKFEEIHGHSMGSIATQVLERNQIKVKVHGMVDFGTKNEQYNGFIEGHRGSKYEEIKEEIHEELVDNSTK